MKCKNNCIITGDIENLKKLDSVLNMNFSMQDVVPVSNIQDEEETMLAWGAGTSMQIQAYMFSDFVPEHIYYSYLTDAPNEMFWRNVSRIYNLKIEYSFYNKELGYIGVYEYQNGMLYEYKYEENEKSKEYNDLLNKCVNNFLDVEEIEDTTNNNVKIISIEELRRRKHD